MKWKNAIKLFVRLYGWELLPIALTLILLLVAKGYLLAEETKLPPGSVPTPGINPL